MIVSVTERGSYKRCHQRWDYTSRNRQNLAEIIPPVAFSLGGLVHKALQLWTEKPDTNAVEHFGKAAVLEIEAIKLRYRKFVGSEISDYELNSLTDMFGLGHEMVSNYQDFWKSPLPKGFELVQAEQTIIMPIPHTLHSCECFGAAPNCINCAGTGKVWHYLEGTLDAIIQDVRSGLLFVLERKTYGKRPREDDLECADQFTAYAWLLEKLNIGQVAGIAYDGLWKRPLIKERGGPRKIEDLFLRTLVTRSPQELQNFERELSLEVQEMAHPSIYRNYRWDGCWDCKGAIKDLCLAEYRGEDAESIRQTQLIPRVSEIPWLDENENDNRENI